MLRVTLNKNVRSKSNFQNNTVAYIKINFKLFLKFFSVILVQNSTIKFIEIV